MPQNTQLDGKAADIDITVTNTDGSQYHYLWKSGHYRLHESKWGQACNSAILAGGYTFVPGDYDGRWDAGVFRPASSTWFIKRSTAGTLIQQFGVTGDVPLPSAYVR